MAIYAVGDIQGCLDALHRLLKKIAFDPDHDQLWLVGDLVNRGPQSLETLRFVKSLGDAAVTVLGNHDLALLRRLHLNKPGNASLDAIFSSPDREALFHWLRQQRMCHMSHGFCMVHAGVHPAWDQATVARLASDVENALRGPDYGDFLENMFGDEPVSWSPDLKGDAHLRFAVNCLTRMRFIDGQCRLDFQSKGAPGSQADSLVPWFSRPRSLSLPVIFGHWSALGVAGGNDCHCIDSGCVWGGPLTAVKLESPDKAPLAIQVAAR